jgi:hypothetical protein
VRPFELGRIEQSEPCPRRTIRNDAGRLQERLPLLSVKSDTTFSCCSLLATMSGVPSIRPSQLPYPNVKT